MNYVRTPLGIGRWKAIGVSSVSDKFRMTTSTEPSNPVGALVGNKYRIVKEIGRGGMATVFSAEHVNIGKAVAVKLLASDLVSSRTVTERFMREARAAAQVRSPHICEVYDVGTYDGRPFIVMELLRGESLYEKLARERQLSAPIAAQIATHAARGLRAAHEHNIVHRDLKPENIFLTTGEEGQLLTKLVDFGLAKFYEPNQDPNAVRLTREGALFGTPAYMSPEQAKAKGSVDHRTDLWALACIVYEMLTGRTVWDIEQGVAMILAQIASAPIPSARMYRPDLPPEFDAWFALALARKPEHRIQDAESFISSLNAALRLDGNTTDPGRLSPSPFSAPYPTHSPHTNTGGPLSTSNAVVARSLPPTALPRSQTPPESARTPRQSRKWWAIAAVTAGTLVAAWFFSPLPRWLGMSHSLPAEGESWALSVGDAQELLTHGDREAALTKVKAAFESGQSKVARSFVTHITAGSEQPGPCKVTGLGHPRPFASKTESSKPSTLLTTSGLLSVWSDADSGPQQQAKVTLLDAALRRVGPEVNITPDGESVRDPELFKTEQGVGLLYWDFSGERAGVYVRALAGDGTPKRPAELLSSQSNGHPYYPAVTRLGRDYWVVWVEASRERVFDLYVRKLDNDLKPVTKAIPLTAYPTPSQGKTQADRPAISAHNGVLHVSYTLRRNNRQSALLLRAHADVVERSTPISPKADTALVGDEESDRFLGQVTDLGADGTHDYSSVACIDAGCYVAWDEIGVNAHLALVSPDGKTVWRRALGSAANRPSVTADGRDVALTWYENKRVQFATIQGEALSEASTVGWVSAVQKQRPPQALKATASREWFVTWSAYEGAVPEPFVARVACP